MELGLTNHGEDVSQGAIAQIAYTDNPMAASVLAEAQHAAAAGLLRPVSSLNGLYDLGALNTLLRAAGQRPVST